MFISIYLYVEREVGGRAGGREREVGGEGEGEREGERERGRGMTQKKHASDRWAVYTGTSILGSRGAFPTCLPGCRCAYICIYSRVNPYASG